MISPTDILIRLFLGALFGGLIGYERQEHGRPAGFRTHLLVCTASVLLMIVSEYYQYLGTMNPSYVRVDPGRIAAGAITGVGFLGAGAILKIGVTVQGLTTAACIWIVSAIGLSVGSGLYFAGTVAFGITIFSLLMLRAVERRMSSLIFRTLTVAAEEDVGMEVISSMLKKHTATVHNIDYDKDLVKGETTYRITISLSQLVPLKGIMEEFASIKGVKHVSIRA
jgi:putative Mg2+ transporter-C (MgtC) family protein